MYLVEDMVVWVNWIATKLLPVGFKIADGAKINILGQWNPNGLCTNGIANLYVISTAVTTNAQQPILPPCPPVSGHEAQTTSHLVSFISLLPVLNGEHTLGGPSQTSGTGSYPGVSGGRTIMVTIQVELQPGPGAPVLGQGIAGAYIDIIRG